MSERLRDVRVPWPKRPSEQSILFNPAFLTVLTHRMVHGYVGKVGRPMPFSLAFLMPAIVLHRRTRDALPHSTVTGLLPWLQNNRDQQVAFAGRVQALRPAVQEGLMFGLAHASIAIEGGRLIVGARRLPMTFSKDPELSAEVRDCLDRASFIGRWFAAAGTESTIFAAWGVAP